MARGAYFDGKYRVLPQAAARIDISRLNTDRVEGDNNLFVYGEGVGLIPPKTPYLITSATQARYLLHDSAEILDAIRLCFDPSGDRPGATALWLVLVNPATQGTFTLKKSGLDSIKLKARGYGLWTNQIAIKLEAGTAAGTRKFTSTYVGTSNVIDNIGRTVFTLRYTGAGSAATVTINQDAAVPANAKLTTAVTGAAADNLDLAFSQYDTPQKLVDAINLTGKYQAVMVTSKGTSSIEIDEVTAADCKGATVSLTADWQELINAINLKDPLVSAEAVAAPQQVMPDNQASAPLAGAVNGATVTDDWDDAISATRVGVPKPDLMLCFSYDAVHHLLIDSLAKELKARAFYGLALKTGWNTVNGRAANLAALQASAKVLNSSRAFLPGLGIRLLRDDISNTTSLGIPELDKTKLVDSRFTAACYAGIAAGGAPSLPLTFKFLRVIGLEADLQPEETELLLESGVCPPIPDPVRSRGWLISRQFSTHLVDDNLVSMEFSIGRVSDWVAENIRKRHYDYVGKEGVEGIAESIKRSTLGILADARRAGQILAFNPDAVVVQIDNDIATVDYEFNPVKPINFVFSTGHVLPTVGTTASAQAQIPLT